MAVLPNQPVRDRLNFLWEKLIRGGVAISRTAADGHLGDVSDFKIDHYTQFDFTTLKANPSHTEDPLILFEPLHVDQITQHPLIPGSTRKFHDYNTTVGNRRWKTSDRTRAVCSYIGGCIRSSKRQSDTSSADFSLLELCDIGVVEHPSPFGLGPRLSGIYPDLHSWHVLSTMENILVMGPHPGKVLLAMHACHSRDGNEDSILFAEFYILVCAMRNRANQRSVPDEEEQRALWDDHTELSVEDYDFEYQHEQHFPVLLLSHVGPQHGRFFYAYMVNDRLKIWQLKLYSFEQEKQSLITLCTQILLSKSIP